ncbi:UDP-glucose dehydrogenase family protein [Bacillus massiliigorillae]|uniref:UDP-glucose dehydrogenase family protein n=1 Tax=Bacillus massiliigorillae TaxID=1243664 RepID=UPI00039E23E4|nr:nucleotide sugar dehydrogenase [Bacillus massiliigorillae]
MQIAVFGLGFVGLTTALGFADKGFSVRGYDINKERCAEIASGKVPFFEPGLDDALARNLGKTFTIAESAIDAAYKSDICFFCVGTPGLSDGSADLAHLLSAIDSILVTVSKVCVLVVKSTIPPGTLKERIMPYVRAKGANNPLAVNPEFLREGKCWDDFMNADRIVCGVTDDTAKNVLMKLYMPFDTPIHFVEPNTAEFIKYLSNSLLAALVSYSNEMALLADAIGDIETARAFRILHEDRRLAGAGINTYIYPGCGYGGYCLPKDTAALDAVALKKGFTPQILEGVISLNNEMPELTARKIARVAGGKTEEIGILGLSFKPGSDDVRDSPAAKIIATLIRDGYVSIHTYDPLAMREFQNTFGLSITYCTSVREVCETCKVVALVTAWEEFKGIDKTFPDIRFVDCRYFLEN